MALQNEFDVLEARKRDGQENGEQLSADNQRRHEGR
jgi:hypothetical protein